MQQLHLERLSGRVAELRDDVRRRRAVRHVVDVVAVNPERECIERPLHGHGLRRLHANGRGLARRAVREAAHAIAEQQAVRRARERRDGVLRLLVLFTSFLPRFAKCS